VSPATSRAIEDEAEEFARELRRELGERVTVEQMAWLRMRFERACTRCVQEAHGIEPGGW